MDAKVPFLLRLKIKYKLKRTINKLFKAKDIDCYVNKYFIANAELCKCTHTELYKYHKYKYIPTIIYTEYDVSSKCMYLSWDENNVKNYCMIDMEGIVSEFYDEAES